MVPSACFGLDLLEAGAELERQQERTALPSVVLGTTLKGPAMGTRHSNQGAFCGVLAWSSHPRNVYLSVLRCGLAPLAAHLRQSDSPTTEERCTIKISTAQTRITRIRGYETTSTTVLPRLFFKPAVWTGFALPTEPAGRRHYTDASTIVGVRTGEWSVRSLAQ